MWVPSAIAATRRRSIASRDARRNRVDAVSVESDSPAAHRFGVLSTVEALRWRVETWRSADERVAFVPTMGNLHAGHLSLVARARELADRVVVSIFVNPLQFGEDEDFDGYPRTPDDDERKLRDAGVDLLFAPTVDEIYPDGQRGATRVDVPGLSDVLCGAHRPGHFSGMATVVVKMLNIVQPDVAVFGEKDYQQLVIIRQMVADLCMPIDIEGGATVREPDGLALSSRNHYLTREERRHAPHLHATLETLAARILGGETDFVALESEGIAALRRHGFEPDYVAIRAASDLRPASPATLQLVILAAARLGKARLIDNVRLQR